LTEGSTRLLPEIFPGVDHVSYFNLRTDAATQLLVDTGHHLGAVAVPYALAVHEDFVMTVLEMLATFGYQRRAPGSNDDLGRNRVTAWNMHEAVWMTLGCPAPTGEQGHALEHFHVLREMRNTQIHAGGHHDQRLRDVVNGLSAPASDRWRRLARRDASDVIATEQIRFTTFDIFTVFATTKAMGRAINLLLRDHLPPDRWAALCVEDYAAISSHPPASDRWMRGLLGHAAMNYSTGSLDEGALFDAAVAAGYRSAGRAWAPQRTPRGKRNPGSRPGG
jgi:hypothetical protein